MNKSKASATAIALMLDTIGREIVFRRLAYKGMVDKGRMTAKDAERKIREMQDVHDFVIAHARAAKDADVSTPAEAKSFILRLEFPSETLRRTFVDEIASTIPGAIAIPE